MEHGADNPASMALEVLVLFLNHLQHLDREEAMAAAASSQAEGFANEDRRTLGVLDGLDSSQTIESVYALSDLSGGHTIWSVSEFASRGDRLVAHLISIDLVDGSRMEHVTIRQYTPAMQIQRAIHLDADLRDEAIRILDELHADDPGRADPAAVERLREQLAGLRRWTRSLNAD